jgi:hypothetical protein
MSFIAEGTANYGKQVVFDRTSRIKFEKEVLFPLAGLDSSLVELFYKVFDLIEQLHFAQNEAARNYLDGNWNKEEAINYLMKYSLHSQERAEKKIQFIETYGAYLINYNLGEVIVSNYIERNGGTDGNPDRRWQLFEQLLTTPQTASGLE